MKHSGKDLSDTTRSQQVLTAILACALSIFDRIIEEIELGDGNVLKNEDRYVQNDSIMSIAS